MRPIHVFALVLAAGIGGYGVAVMAIPQATASNCNGVNVEGTCVPTAAYLGLLHTAIAANAY
jgi:hypothetical protein